MLSKMQSIGKREEKEEGAKRMMRGSKRSHSPLSSSESTASINQASNERQLDKRLKAIGEAVNKEGGCPLSSSQIDSDNHSTCESSVGHGNMVNDMWSFFSSPGQEDSWLSNVESDSEDGGSSGDEATSQQRAAPALLAMPTIKPRQPPGARQSTKAVAFLAGAKWIPGEVVGRVRSSSALAERSASHARRLVGSCDKSKLLVKVEASAPAHAAASTRPQMHSIPGRREVERRNMLQRQQLVRSASWSPCHGDGMRVVRGSGSTSCLPLRHRQLR